jgi:HK97 family phage major capsid protein
MSRLKDLRAQRATLLTEAKALQNSDSLTDDLRGQIETKLNAIDSVDKDIKNEMKLLAFDSTSAQGQIDPEMDKMFNQLHLGKVFSALSNGQKLNGVAAELHEEAVREAQASGIALKGQFHLPQSYAHKRYQAAANVTTGSAGGLTVQTDVKSIIDYLQANLPFIQLGATMFTDVVGNLLFPRMVEGTDVTTGNETVAATDTEPTFGSFTLSPNRVPAFIEVTEQLMLQSSSSVNDWINKNLGYKVGKAMHAKIITDFLANSDVNAVSLGTDGAALDWAKVVEFETKIGEANGAEALKWLLNPTTIGKLKTTQKVSGQAVFLYEKGLLNDYEVVKSTLLPKNLTKGAGTNLSAAILGYWSDLYIAQWGGVSFLVNPYAKDTTGIVRVNAYTYMDSDIAQPKNFAMAKDIVTA